MRMKSRRGDRARNCKMHRIEGFHHNNHTYLLKSQAENSQKIVNFRSSELFGTSKAVAPQSQRLVRETSLGRSIPKEESVPMKETFAWLWMVRTLTRPFLPKCEREGLFLASCRGERSFTFGLSVR